jgi:PKD repeat protein
MLNLNSKIAGLYTVVVTNPDGKFGTLSRGFTVLAAGAPTASFTGTPTSGTSPLTVSFTDSSTQPSSWNWSFGEGNFSTVQNPVHTYYRGGAYTVSLNVTNAKGTDTLTRTDYIIVNGDKIGIFRNSTGYWKLDYNNTGAVSKSFRYGTTKDIPLAGDWNGDGTTDAAVFRPSNGNWYVNYFKDTITDKTFHFGMTGDIPLVGDWDGNGISDAGVFRPSVGNWYLDTTKTGVVNKTFHFGMAGDIPLVGDWDGNGISDAGVFRPSVGNWYMDTTKTGVVNKTFHFGMKGDIPVVGDWDGNGTSDAAVFRPSNGYWYLNYYKNSIVNKKILFGTPGDTPTIGIWSTGHIRIVPVAAFVANTTSGRSPLAVKFTDRSPGCPTSWHWSFGDGTTSILQNPAHTYTSNKKTQSYTVTLIVTNSVGSNTKTITGYITVVK